MSDEDRSPLTNDEQREVDRFKEDHPSADRADLEDAMRRRRQHAARIAKRKRDAAELLANNAATIARSDLTPDERREAKMAAADGKSAESAVNMARQIAHGTNGTAADDAADSQVGDRQRERLRAEAEAPKVLTGKPKRTRKPKPAPEAPKVDEAAQRALTAKLGDALPWGDEAAALLNRIVYAEHHAGADCPRNRRPRAAELDELDEWVGAETQSAIATEVAAILCDDVARALGDSGEPFDAPHLLMLTVEGDLSVGARIGGSPVPTLERLMTPGGAAAGWAVLIKKRGAVTALAVLHDLWCQCPPDRRPRHPLGPVVAAWQRFAPFAVTAEDRADRRIMPALRIVGPTPERERGRLFGGLVDDRTRDAAASLSLFPDMEPDRPRVPILEIVDRAGLPIRSRGRGAPLEARLLVRGGLLMIRPQDRRLATVRIAVTVGEMLDGLWPPGPDGRRHVAQHWPRLLDALHRARDWTVPDADGGRWFPMALRRLPPNGAAGTPALDDLVVIDLAPVPGAVTGATVDLPWLDRMGVESGPKWRAYIAARTLMWRPGKTRRPVPGTNGRRYGWSADPADYPVVPAEDLRRMAFGDGDIGHRTRAAVLAPWESLPDVQIEPATDPRTGVRGYRLRPTDRDE